MAYTAVFWQLTKMLFLIILGATIAVVHHLSNTFLSGKSTDRYPQTWVKNIALAAAFIAKSAFAAAISMAFRETLWEGLRARPTKISSLDKLFTVQSDPFSFLSKDAFKTAPWALLLAALQWSMPLAAIFPPGTLNVRIAARETKDTQCHVPTFNATLGRTWYPGGLGIKTFNTPDLDRWSYETVVPGRINFVPSSTFCGTNCSYSQTFVAPHMQCQHLDNKDLIHDIPIEDSEHPSRCSLKDNTACFLYGSPAMKNPTANNSDGTFTMTYATSYKYISNDKYLLNMNYSRLSCDYTHAHYNVSIVYHNDIPTHNVSITPFSLPDTFRPDYSNMPDEDIEDWDIEMTARGLYQYFQLIWLAGRIQLFRYPNAGDNLKLSLESYVPYTPLIDTITEGYIIRPKKDLVTSIPELFRNFTISTFTMNPNNTNVTTCTLVTTSPIYHYNPVGLVAAYGVAAILSILCAGCGLAALRRNAAPVRPIFSQLLGATRNKDLRGVVRTKSDGTWNVFEARKLKFGDGDHPSVFVVEQESQALVNIMSPPLGDDDSTGDGGRSRRGMESESDGDLVTKDGITHVLP